MVTLPHDCLLSFGKPVISGLPGLSLSWWSSHAVLPSKHLRPRGSPGLHSLPSLQPLAGLPRPCGLPSRPCPSSLPPAPGSLQRPAATSGGLRVLSASSSDRILHSEPPNYVSLSLDCSLSHPTPKAAANPVSATPPHPNTSRTCPRPQLIFSRPLQPLLGLLLQQPPASMGSLRLPWHQTIRAARKCYNAGSRRYPAVSKGVPRQREPRRHSLSAAGNAPSHTFPRPTPPPRHASQAQGLSSLLLLSGILFPQSFLSFWFEWDLLYLP